MAGRRLVTLRCAHDGCTATNVYEVSTKTQDLELRARRWRCWRHREPSQVVTVQTPVKTQTLVVAEAAGHHVWRNEHDASGGRSLTYGPGFIAAAGDFPAGTRLVVTARLNVREEP